MLSLRMPIQKKVWLESGIRLSWQVICKPKVEHCSTHTRTSSIPSPPQNKPAWHQMHLPFHSSSPSIHLSAERCFNYLLSKLSDTPVLEAVVVLRLSHMSLKSVCVCKFIFVSRERCLHLTPIPTPAATLYGKGRADFSCFVLLLYTHCEWGIEAVTLNY